MQTSRLAYPISLDLTALSRESFLDELSKIAEELEVQAHPAKGNRLKKLFTHVLLPAAAMAGGYSLGTDLGIMAAKKMNLQPGSKGHSLVVAGAPIILGIAGMIGSHAAAKALEKKREAFPEVYGHPAGRGPRGQ